MNSATSDPRLGRERDSITRSNVLLLRLTRDPLKCFDERHLVVGSTSMPTEIGFNSHVGFSFFYKF
jgi:hypothetical protein